MTQKEHTPDEIPLLSSVTTAEKKKSEGEKRDPQECNNDEDLSNDWQAIWNIINGQQGAALLGAPYAISVGGVWSLVSLLMVAIIANYTSKILVKCLFADDDEEDDESDIRSYSSSQSDGSISIDENGRPQRRIYNSYMEIADATIPGGGYFVRFSVFVSAFSIAIMYLQTVSAIAYDTVGRFVEVPQSLLLGIGAGFCLLFVFVSNLTKMSFLSLLAIISLVLLIISVTYFSMGKPDEWYTEYLLRFEFADFMLSTSIIVFNYSSQFFIIDIFDSMKEKTHFRAVLNFSTIISTFLFFAISLPACLVFGPSLNEFVILSFPVGIFKYSVNVAFIIKSIFSFPFAIYLSELYLPKCPFEVPDWATPSTEMGAYYFACFRRAVLVVLSFVVAMYLPSYAFILHFIGGSIMVFTEIILPAWFHWRLKRKAPFIQQLADVLIIVFGVIVGITTIFFEVENLFTPDEPMPTTPLPLS
ncbi:Vesicular inhibitory amino acid transporter [Holothuria leucospilota]|uniref:Vesicular inhibitory amino acid transporter n=1 Tax=Holothuria leucospilota TaxID=206669 RepID=A0A9Q1H8I3_HOLLE|nr:Vesicular inhibitory amino acid transporter [Holothuria leucospilota]